MTLSDLSIKKPVFAWMIMFALLLFGAIGFMRLGVSQNPDIDFPVVSVQLSWEGAAPEVMENEVVDPVEEALMTIEGIEKVSSTSRFGNASVSAEFVLSKNIDVAVQEIQTKIAQTQRVLPREMDPPIILKINPEDRPILWVGVSGAKDYKAIVEYVRDHLKDQFQTVPGVGEVFLGGFVEPNLRIWLDPKRMEANQITVDDVASAIETQHAELPAGVIRTLKEERSVRVMGEASSVEEMENLTIPSRVGQGMLWRTIRLKDVATIEDGLADIRRISRINGKTSIGLGIRKQRGANSVAVAKLVKKKIEELQKSLPQGIEVGVNFDSTVYIEENMHELIFTLILAVLFTSLVCWLFLGSASSTLNVFLAIPTALGGTFMVIYFLGFTLNTISLMALSLVIGIVVDDAIVVIENIVRHREMGKSRIQAAIEGAREITFSVIVISSAVIAIFLPVAFMKGMIGKFFLQFGVTVSVAVAFSLLEAITLAPMRCSQFLEVGHTSWIGKGMDRFMRGLSNLYRKILERILNHRWKIVFASLILFALSLQIIKHLRKEMTPPQDQSVFLVRLQAPPGSSLPFTDNVFKKVEEFMMGRKEVKRYFGAIGGFGGGEVNTGVMFVTMHPPKQRPVEPSSGRFLSQQQFMQVVRKELKTVPGIRSVSLQDFSQMQAAGAGQGYPIEFSVRGPDWEKLGELSEIIKEKLAASGLAVDVDTDYLVGVPEVRVVPDRDKAAAMGVTIQSVARAINASVGGVRVGKYSKGGRRYDIRLSLRDRDRASLQDISNIWVRNIRGELVSLSQVTRVLEKPTLLTIHREERERAVTVQGNIAPGKSQEEALAKAQAISKEVLPEGYRAVVKGGSEQFKKSFRELLFALLLGIVIAYMILAAQFNSFVHPFTVLLALPFSISGALIGLLLANQSINMMSLIGILLLMGIVKKNSILLVDFTNARRAEGLDVNLALLEACPLRLRPILMTSFAIIAGALPATIGFGPGAEVRAPMGVTVIGGTILSTLLTLFLVPCAYSLLSKIESKKKVARSQEVLSLLSKK